MNSLNIDPGFAWMGWSVTQLAKKESDDCIVEMGLISTEKSGKKTNVRAASDNFRRTRELALELHMIINQYKPSVMCIEAESMVRSASASRKVGLAYGSIATLAALAGIPVVMPSPQQVRKTLEVGSKEDVAKLMFQRFKAHKGSRQAVNRFLHQYTKGRHHNHAWDSLGIMVACGDSEVIRALRIARH